MTEIIKIDPYDEIKSKKRLEKNLPRINQKTIFIKKVKVGISQKSNPITINRPQISISNSNFDANNNPLVNQNSNNINTNNGNNNDNNNNNINDNNTNDNNDSNTNNNINDNNTNDNNDNNTNNNINDNNTNNNDNNSNTNNNVNNNKTNNNDNNNNNNNNNIDSNNTINTPTNHKTSKALSQKQIKIPNSISVMDFKIPKNMQHLPKLTFLEDPKTPTSSTKNNYNYNIHPNTNHFSKKKLLIPNNSSSKIISSNSSSSILSFSHNNNTNNINKIKVKDFRMVKFLKDNFYEDFDKNYKRKLNSFSPIGYEQINEKIMKMKKINGFWKCFCNYAYPIVATEKFKYNKKGIKSNGVKEIKDYKERKEKENLPILYSNSISKEILHNNKVRMDNMMKEGWSGYEEDRMMLDYIIKEKMEEYRKIK